MMKFIIVTGLSGAGKSQAVKFLEDLGFFCIDNLPPALILKFAEIYNQSRGSIDNVAIVTDIRGGKFFDQLQSSLDELHKEGFNYDILFLEASDETLIKRFKTSRRLHPLSMDGRIIRGINAEREKLEEIKTKASFIIDTTDMSTAQLKQEIIRLFIEGGKKEILMVNLISFGFKYGIPLDADLVFDVRFLPNPYYIESLKKLSGHDQEVREYVMKWPEALVFMSKLLDMIEFLIPYYISEGKNQLVIAIGCTGGRHRSVTIARLLSEKLKNKECKVIIEHRDVRKEGKKGKVLK